MDTETKIALLTLSRAIRGLLMKKRAGHTIEITTLERLRRVAVSFFRTWRMDPEDLKFLDEIAFATMSYLFGEQAH